MSTYDAIAVEQTLAVDTESITATSHSNSSSCAQRADSSTVWHAFKAWYLFLLHLALSIVLVVWVIQIDGKDFRIESQKYKSVTGIRVSQTQVTLVLSIALVVVRLFAGTCSLLLAWRIIYVLLEKRGITLWELTHLSNHRVPIVPEFRRGARSQVVWSLWATITIILLWPAGIAAPLASSSVSWIPASRPSNDLTSITIPAVGKYADWAALLYPEWRTVVTVRAGAFTGRDPAYAFQDYGTALRRYFSATEAMPTDTIMNITLPYITTNLRWIDADSFNSSDHIGDHAFSDVNDSFGARQDGLVSFVRDEKWDGGAAQPQKADVFMGKKMVAVKVATINKGDVLEDGTIVDKNTSCPATSDDFGRLPDVKQYQTVISWNGRLDDDSWAAHECYIVAEATIVAGVYPGHDCTVNASTGSTDRYATCHVRDDVRNNIEADWLASLALDFTPESLKYSVSQNYSQPWLSKNLDDYTTGMLTLGYHAAHGALVKSLGNSSELVVFNPTVPVVRIGINRTRLYVWLGLNVALTFSATFVYLAQLVTSSKPIRDTTLAALTVDVSEVAHSGLAQGLCNAVALSKQDHKLPKLRWKKMDDLDPEQEGQGQTYCDRSVTFVNESGEDHVPVDTRVRKRRVATVLLAKLGQVPGSMS